MEAKPISPAAHAIVDYALVTSLFILPTALNFNKKARSIYAAEAAVLLVYVAMTNTPVAVKPVIPFPVHGKVDPFNVATFALQTLIRPFRKQKKAAIFNIIFTTLSAAAVLLTDWKNEP